MAMTDERRALLLAYCRLDPLDLSEDDLALLESLYLAAVDYMADAGVKVPASPGRLAKFDLVVNAMVLDAWDARGSQVAGAAPTEDPAIRRAINQLKFTEPVSDSDTGPEGA